MAEAGMEKIVLAFVCMITGVIVGLMIYYSEMIEDRAYEYAELEDAVKQQLQEEQKKVTGASGSTSTDVSGSTKSTILTGYESVPTSWMNVPPTDAITKGRLFRITAPMTYVDVSNNGDASCNAVVAGAKVADYRHLKYAYSQTNGARNDASANWCDFNWARGGKTSTDGVAFSIADQTFIGANASTCSANGVDSSGIRVLNLYKIDNTKKAGLICYTDLSGATSNAFTKVTGSTIPIVPESFTDGTQDIRKKVPEGVSGLDDNEQFSSVKEAFINYDNTRVRVGNTNIGNNIYSLFRG